MKPGVTIRHVVLNFLLLILLMVPVTLEARASGSTIVISPSDSLRQAVEQLGPGDTLILKPGTYLEALEIRQLQGTRDQPIAIKAERDGQAIIDGESQRRAILVENSSYINIEGIFARDAWTEWNTDVVDINNSHHVILRRVTAYKSKTINMSDYPFKIWNGSHHILMEDCAGYGSARKMLLVNYDTDHVIVRRFFSRWNAYDLSPDDWIQSVDLYGGERVGHDNLFENTMIFYSSASLLKVRGLGAGGGDRHKVLGSVSLNGNDLPFFFSGCSNCLFQDNVAIGRKGFLAKVSRDPFLAPMENDSISNFTLVSHEDSFSGIKLSTSEAGRDSLDTRNSFLMASGSSIGLDIGGPDSAGTFTHAYNAFHGFAPENLYSYWLTVREDYEGKTTNQIMDIFKDINKKIFLNFFKEQNKNGDYLRVSEGDDEAYGESFGGAIFIFLAAYRDLTKEETRKELVQTLIHEMLHDLDIEIVDLFNNEYDEDFRKFFKIKL